MEPRRNVSAQTFESMTQKSDSAFLPVLIDIKHPAIVWTSTDLEQQNGHLRLICDTRGVKYKGNDNEVHYYAPCQFSVKMPKEDGKSKSNASITISCIDSRVIEVIRSITESITCNIVAMYAKIKTSEGKQVYSFSKLYGRKFEMGSVTWNGISAQWDLNPDSRLDLSIPRDKGSSFRCPSIMEQ